MTSQLGRLGYIGPLLLFGITGAILVSVHSIDSLMPYTVWQLLNLLLNKALKETIRQPRPAGAWDGPKESIDQYGMPSGHAQIIFSQCGLLLYMAFYKQTRWLITALALGLACVTAWQRVAYNRHTLLQVIVGALIGLAFGWWFGRYYSMAKFKANRK